MLQKKLVFIVVVFGLLVSGGFSAVSGAGQWKFYGCCYIQAYTECRGPKYFPDQASCLRYAGEGIAECRAGAAEYKTTFRVTGGCTYNDPDEEARTKCLNSCASFYVCSWENGMCIKRINPDYDSNNPFHPMTTTLKVTTTTHRTTTTTQRKTTTTYTATTNTVTTTATASTATTAKTTSTTLKDHNLEQLEPYKPYEDKSDYCGPEDNKLVMAFIPRGPPGSGADFNTGCYNHDKCYSECERTQNTKEHCDQAFLNDMDETCNTKAEQNPCPDRAWYNPIKYTCPITSAIGSLYCHGSARMYQGAVANFANCFNAYPCRTRAISWLPCT